MYRVDASLFEPLTYLHRILERIPLGLVIVERVVVLDGADLHLEMEVLADLLANLTDDVEQKARAVRQRAAVVVLAVVDARAEELRDEVSVGPVKLDAVGAGLPRASGRGAERVSDIGDLFRRHPLGFEAVQRVGPIGRAETLRVFDARHVALPAAVAQLDEVLAVAFVVDLLDELFPEWNALVAVDRRVVRHDAAAHRHRHERRDDRADAAAREFQLPVDAGLGAGTVVVVEASRDIRAEDAVLRRERAEREW